MSDYELLALAQMEVTWLQPRRSETQGAWMELANLPRCHRALFL